MRTGEIEFEWIHSHAGLDHMNDLADLKAKEACNFPTHTILPLTDSYHLYTKGSLLDTNPSMVIKEIHQNSHRLNFEDYIQKKFGKGYDVDLALKIINRKNPRYPNSRTFRIKSLLGILPTKAVTHQRNKRNFLNAYL